jgi:hypothetical protein
VLLARSVAVTAMFALLSAPVTLHRWFGGDTAPYIVSTIALVVLTVATVLPWRDERHTTLVVARSSVHAASAVQYVATIIATAAAVTLVLIACGAWLHQILTIPIDPYRGDMLVVVREGLRRVLQGLNPYTTYHVPWSAPLPYGPMLWAPYAIPMLMRIDIRFLSVAAALLVPVSCGAAGIASAWRGQFAAAAGALLMLGAIALNGPLEQFVPAGHTAVYWPLLALFAWLATREQWRAAAIALGLLVVSRTTMVAVVPVLLMAVWLRDRPRFAAACALVSLTIAVPFLPFAIRDPRALTYAMYGSYQTVIKTAVWPNVTVPHTIGLTGVLLTHHLHRYVEAVQIAVMAIVYVACFALIRRGRAPVALMATALLAFSLTTLWPVTYIYFDVFLLFAAGVLAGMPWLDVRWSTSSILRAWAAVAIVAVILDAGAGTVMLRLRANERPAITWRDEPRQASVLLLRQSISPALVDVQIGAGSVGPQRMGVALNGAPLGEVEVSPGADHVMLTAPESLWQIGANSLDLTVAAPIMIRGVIARPTR